MKERTPEQLKGQVRSFSGKRGLQPQEVLQMFYRISKDEIDFDMLKAAVSRTSQKRNSQKELAEWADICDEMKHDTTLMRLCDNYRKNNQYASEVSYEEVIHAVEEIGKRISD